MSLYSDYASARTRQIIADITAVVMIVITVTAAAAVASTIRALGAFGRDLEAAGLDFQEGLAGAADGLGQIPLVGGGIRGPFDLAASAGASVAEAGRLQQSFIELIATLSGVVIAVVPLSVLVVVWLVPRIRFALRSHRLRGMIVAGMTADTLAARALAAAPLRHLAEVHPDPAAAWRANDPVVVRRLAELELRRAGIGPSALP